MFAGAVLLFVTNVAAILATGTHDSKVQGKVLGVTLGWAALNTAALVADRRALRSA